MQSRWAGVLLILAALFFSQSCKSKPELCAVCQREIHKAYQTTLMVHGKKELTCCIACSMHFETSNRDARLTAVTDYSMARSLDPASAVYLFGPNIHTCGDHSTAVRTGDSTLYVAYDRCEPAVLAFQNTQEAAAVQNELGGRIVNLVQLESLFGVR